MPDALHNSQASGSGNAVIPLTKTRGAPTPRALALAVSWPDMRPAPDSFQG